jgi:hypothetical protein
MRHPIHGPGSVVHPPAQTCDHFALASRYAVLSFLIPVCATLVATLPRPRARSNAADAPKSSEKIALCLRLFFNGRCSVEEGG